MTLVVRLLTFVAGWFGRRAAAGAWKSIVAAILGIIAAIGGILVAIYTGAKSILSWFFNLNPLVQVLALTLIPWFLIRAFAANNPGAGRGFWARIFGALQMMLHDLFGNFRPICKYTLTAAAAYLLLVSAVTWDQTGKKPTGWEPSRFGSHIEDTFGYLKSFRDNHPMYQRAYNLVTDLEPRLDTHAERIRYMPQPATDPGFDAFKYGVLLTVLAAFLFYRRLLGFGNDSSPALSGGH